MNLSSSMHNPITADYIAYHASFGVKAAIEFEGGVVSYLQLKRDIDLAVRYLSTLNLVKGDLLVIGLHDTYLHLVFILATDVLGILSASIQMTEDPLPIEMMASARLVLTQQDYDHPEVSHHQLPADWQRVAHGVKQVESPTLSDDDPVRLVRSSGTTGTPKLILILRSKQTRWLSFLSFYSDDSRHSRFYVAAPFAVNTFYMRAVLVLRLGGTLLIGGLPMLSRATQTWMLPSTIEMVMSALPADFVKPQQLEIRTGGAPLMPAMRERVLSKLATSIVNSYGTNEVGPICQMRPDGVGVVVPGTEVQVVDDDDHALPLGQPGHLRARNQIMIDAYFGNPTATADRFREGWFYPGDEAVLLSPTELRLVGRIDDMLNFAGFKRMPDEVEEQVKQISGVVEAAAMTKPSADGAVCLCLALVLEDGLTKEQVIPDLVKHLKLPAKELLVVQVKGLPRTNTGKIRRKQLLPLFG